MTILLPAPEISEPGLPAKASDYDIEPTASCESCQIGGGASFNATDKSVLGDFNDATFEYYGVRSRFFREDGKFLAETDGPDGKLSVFEVKYTFGVDPLQQYVVEFPDGRLQALSLAWDSRPRDKGGRRWFHLYPDEEINFSSLCIS